ncbi:MAG: hypothetical protein CSB21_02725 [Deltaproteobacteria bacterium]|nr:MAG: hypothetical protein CSB21_02725 [Deltaproteobacteria bacterium]
MKNKYTPLHLNVVKGDVETIEELLKRGANPLAKDINDQTPFDFLSYTSF